MRQLLRTRLFASTSLDSNLSGQAPAANRPRRENRAVWLAFLAAAALAFDASSAMAQTAPAGLPTDGVFTRGQGTISQPSANTMDISQGSTRGIIDWATFSIGDGKQVHIDNAGGATLNRVNGGQLSQIHGMLSATGSVYLMNPQGVIVGPGGKVITGGSFVASTRQIDGDAFMGGGPAAVSGKSGGAIVNQGLIVSQNGSVVMIARSVSNSGTIEARGGRASLVAADDVLLATTDGNADNIFVSVGSATGGDVTQAGRIEAAAVELKAAGGNIFALAGNRDGLVQASGTSTINGQLWLTAPEGKVEVTGQLAAANADGSGGSVLVNGAEVEVGGTARIAATGNRGGEILIGASQFGTGAELAERMTVASGATIVAGGPAGGGRIETSGLTVDIGAARIDAGAGGLWLLDPDDITIDTALASTITTSLDGGTDVLQQTTSGGTGGLGDITVAAPITWTGTGNLTLDAFRNIAVNEAISGGGSVTLRAAGSTTIAANVASTADVLVETGSFINQAGAGALSAGGRWLVYSGDPANDTTGGLVPGFYQYAAPAGTAPAAGGNGLLYSVAPSVSITLGAVTKSYDGTADAILDDTNTTVAGLINDDVWTLDGTFATKDAGTGINVTADNFQATHNGIPVFGYATNAPVTAATGTITQAILTASIVGNPTKTYNRTTSVSLAPANFELTGVAQGETINVLGAATASYDSPNAGARTVNATFATPNFTAGSGTLLTNYVLPTTATGAGTINPAMLIISGVTANDKVYDSTIVATLNTGTATLFGVIAGDTVTVDAGAVTGTFATKNVGTAIPVTIDGLALSGADAANYTVGQPADLNADITRATLVVSGATTNDKIYDGTTTATVDASNLQVTGLFPGDDVAGGGTSQINFANKNVGNGIPITITNVSLVGADAGNYDITFSPAMTGNILPRPLTLDYLDTPSKVYDGTPNFTANRLFAVLDGLVPGETILVT